MIASLENKGFIRRSGGSQDRRSVEVYLTDQGRELGQTLESIHIAAREILSKGLTEEETSELRRLLGIVRNNVRRV